MIVGIARASLFENSHDSVSPFDITSGEWKTAGRRENRCVWSGGSLLQRVLASN